MNNIVNLLKEKNKTISTMESCTGGALANYITNIPDASMVYSFSAITYSNEYKIKMGVDKDIIDKYSVYSIETARSMAKNISDYTNSSYGVGVTGKLKKADLNNPRGEIDVCYLSIYDRNHKEYYDETIKLLYESRIDNKNQIINTFVELLSKILEK